MTDARRRWSRVKEIFDFSNVKPFAGVSKAVQALLKEKGIA